MTSVARFTSRMQKLGVNLSSHDGKLDLLPEGLTDEERAFARTRHEDIQDFVRTRRMALPPYKASQAGRVVCSLTQESWFRWSCRASVQAKNDRVQFVHFFTGKNVPDAERCLRALLSRHDALRMAFSVREDMLVSDLLAASTLSVEEVDGRGMTRENLQADLHQFNSEAIPFEEGWALRARLYSLENGVLCALSMHHLIVDGHSLGVMKSDLLQISEGLETGKGGSFLDYAASERNWFEGAGGLTVAQYWINWLGRQEHLRAPTGKFPLQWRKGECLTYTYTLDSTVQKRLAQIASDLHSTLFFLYLGVYATALSKWSGQDRFPLRINGTLRATPNLWPVVGNMITADLIECDFAYLSSFGELLQRLEIEHRAATTMRIPHLFCLPAHAGLSSRDGIRIGGAVAATINYFSQRSQRGPVKNLEVTAEKIAWPPVSLGVQSDMWSFPVWPIYLRLVDTDHGLVCKFEFHADLLLADEREALIRLFFGEIEALIV